MIYLGDVKCYCKRTRSWLSDDVMVMSSTSPRFQWDEERRQRRIDSVLEVPIATFFESSHFFFCFFFVLSPKKIGFCVYRVEYFLWLCGGCIEMRPISQEKEQNVVALIEKGRNNIKNAKSVGLAQSTINRVRKRLSTSVALFNWGRLKVLTEWKKRFASHLVIVGCLETATEAWKMLWREMGVNIQSSISQTTPKHYKASTMLHILVIMYRAFTLSIMSIMHNRQGYLNARGYIANLKQYLCSTLLAFGFNLEAIIFKQDNVAVHTTKIVWECEWQDVGWDMRMFAIARNVLLCLLVRRELICLWVQHYYKWRHVSTGWKWQNLHKGEMVGLEKCSLRYYPCNVCSGIWVLVLFGHPRQIWSPIRG